MKRSLLLATVLCASACGKAPAPAPAAPSAAPAIQTSADPAGPKDESGPAAAGEPAADAGPTVAFVGESPITADEVAALVVARFEDGGQAPSFPAVRAAAEDLVDRKVLVDAARAAGFAPAGTSDEDAVAAFMKAKVEDTARSSVTTDEIARYWGANRKAQVLFFPDREAASTTQVKLLEAIAATPDKAGEIVAETKVALLAGSPPPEEPWVATPFNSAGLSRLGAPIAPIQVSRGAFAVPELGSVSPPIPLPDGRWILVQPLAGDAGIDPAVLTQANLDEARQALGSARAESTATKLMMELREAAHVKIDQAQISALADRMVKKGDHLVRAGGERRLVQDLRKWRMTHLRQVGKDRLPGVAKDAQERPRRATIEEVQKKMGGTGPGATP